MVRFKSNNGVIIGTSLKVLFSSLSSVPSLEFLGWQDAHQADSCDVFVARDPLQRFRSLYKDKFIKNMPKELQHCQQEAFSYLITPMTVAHFVFHNLAAIEDMHFWEQTRNFKNPGRIIKTEDKDAVAELFRTVGSETIHTNRTVGVELQLDAPTTALVKETYKQDYELLGYQ